MIEYADVVCGLAWGDEAKGKITASLASTMDYDVVCRWAGGNNAGHTVYVDGTKYKTHLVPSGVFYGIPSIVGPACVVDPLSFLKELSYLEKHGFDISCVKISPRAHIVTRYHISEDKNNHHKRLGTTAKGIAPCYSDKARRTGYQAKDEEMLSGYLWDEKLEGKVLCEGAQGVWLDMDHGNYPYVTSSVTLPYGACSLGFPPQLVRKIYGAAKIYDTRSGVDPVFPESLLENALLLQIADAGEEFGVTTGRRRKVNWLNLSKLIDSVNLTGATHVVLSKVDVLTLVGAFKLYDKHLMGFDTFNDMSSYIDIRLRSCCPLLQSLKFSHNPYEI